MIFMVPILPICRVCPTYLCPSFWTSLSLYLSENTWSKSLEKTLHKRHHQTFKLWKQQVLQGMLWTQLLFPNHKDPAILSLQIAEKKGIVNILWPQVSQHILKKHKTIQGKRHPLIKASQQALMASALIVFCYVSETLTLTTTCFSDIAWVIIIGLIIVKPKPCPHYYYHAQLAYISSRLQSQASIQQALMESHPLSQHPLLFLHQVTHGLSLGHDLQTIILSLTFIPERHRKNLAKSLDQGTLHLDIEHLYTQSQHAYLKRIETRLKMLQTSLIIYALSILLWVIFYGYIPLMKDMMTPNL